MRDTEETRDALAKVFPDRPLLAPEEGAWQEEKARVIGEIQAALARPRPTSRMSASGFHWGETAAVVGLSLGLALVVGRIVPGPLRNSPIQAFRAVDTQGQVLCDRNDGKHWTACDPLADQGFVGLRTLDNGMVTVESVVGVRMRLDAFSTLLVADASDSAMASRVTLSEGRVDVRVPTLGPNHRFSVVTPNATLTVLGTAFTVEVKKSPNQPSQTCVKLREGGISIHTVGRDQDLVAPATWGCSAAVSSPGAVEATARDTSERPPAPAGTDKSRLRGKRRITGSTARPTQYWPNRLFHRALVAEQRKDLVTAERYLRNLLTLYPDSVAAPQARVVLERIESQKPGALKPDTQKPESPETDPQKSESQKPEAHGPEPQKPEARGPEPQKPEPQTPEPQKPEPQKPEPQKPEIEAK